MDVGTDDIGTADIDSEAVGANRPVMESTIFAELSAAAAPRSARSLLWQCVACVGVSVAIVRLAPTLWSVGVLCSVGAVYALWALLHRAVAAPDSLARARMLPRLVAIAGTGLAIVGTLGLTHTLFFGRGQSPYYACGPKATTKYCLALKHPVRVTHLP